MRALVLLILATALTACSGEPDTAFYGYAEGDFIQIAPETPGRILRTGAAEGETVRAGDSLFSLDAIQEDTALAAAEARLRASQARFDDAAAGAREPEIAAVRDQLDQARAAEREARDTLERTRELFGQGHVSQARLDQAARAAEAATARVAEMRERLSLVQLPARENQLAALQAEIEAVRAERDRAADARARRDVLVPVDGRVHRQIRHAGELSGPNLPVFELLPDGAVHALLFIPADALASLPVGSVLDVTCDSCPAGLTARIRQIADAAEFTPPVIYSDNERARLVYRAEAEFDGSAPPPGTPLRLEPRP